MYVSSVIFFPSGFPSKILFAFLLCQMRATCPNNLILVALLTPIIYGEMYKS